LEIRLFRKIQLIDDATTDQDLRVPPGNHFEKLRGNHFERLRGNHFEKLRGNHFERLRGNHFERLRGNFGDLLRSASTSSGGSYFIGMAAEAKHQGSIWTIIAMSEAAHVDYEAEAGKCRRNIK
jgi:hypothetical protein